FSLSAYFESSAYGLLLYDYFQEKQTNSTNSFNTVGTPVSAAGPTFTNDDLSSPVNAAEASNAFKDHLFE
ncbi:hypothetical protein Tco_1357132, partial [Tanacetum coccineum]